jgi:hypothetical protein
MVTPVTVSTVDAITVEVLAQGETALDVVDHKWVGSAPRLTFAGWMRNHYHTLRELHKNDWVKEFQLFKSQRIRVGKHMYGAYRFVMVVLPLLELSSLSDLTPENEKRLHKESHVYTCYLVHDECGMITTVVNPDYLRDNEWPKLKSNNKPPRAT